MTASFPPRTALLRPAKALAIALPLHTSLQAQVMMPIGNEFLVNQTIAGSQTMPHVASDEDGGHVIVWTSGNSIMARRYGADHQPTTDEFLVTANGTQAFVYHWSDGRFVIAWSGNPSGMKVLYADNTLSETYTVPGGDGVDMDIRNDVLLVASTAGQHIQLRKWDLLTHAWMGAAVQVSEAPSNSYQLPQVRWTSTGNIVVVYSNGSGIRRIYRKTFNAALLAQIPEEIVTSLNTGTVGVVNVSINALDQLLIFARFGVNGTDVFWGRVLAADGTSLSEGVGNMSAPYAYYHTDCELYDNGAVVLTNNYRTSLNDPDGYNVRANYGLFLGNPNTGWQVASTTVSGEQRYPAVTKLPNGGFLMVWNGNGFQGDSDGVYARAFSAADFPTAVVAPGTDAFQAWPNPFIDQLHIVVNASTWLDVLDPTGRSVKTTRLRSGTNDLSLQDLAPGPYLLHWAQADGSRHVHRVVKQ
jgi:hypothetical protein